METGRELYAKRRFGYNGKYSIQKALEQCCMHLIWVCVYCDVRFISFSICFEEWKRKNCGGKN